MEESELRRLVKTKNGCKIPILPPIPDLRLIERLPFTPMLPYVRKKEKQKEFRSATVAKSRRKILCSQSLEKEEDDYDTSRDHHVAIIKSCASKLKPPPMLDECENKILSLVPASLQIANPRLTQEIVIETKEEWNDTMHKLAVKTVVRDTPGVPRKRYQESNFKMEGITPYFRKMLRNRRKIKKEALFLHPFIRLINESAETKLSIPIINLAEYRLRGPMTLLDLNETMLDRIKRADNFVSRCWYSILVKWLKSAKGIRDIPITNVPQFVKCATKFIAIQIQEYMRKSIDFLIISFSDPNSVPILNIDLIFDEKFEYFPSKDDIYKIFHNVIDSISLIAQRLMPIEEYLNIPYSNDVLPVHYSKNSLAEDHIRLSEQLDKMFKPLVNYVCILRQKYEMLCGEDKKICLLEFVENNNIFETYRDKIIYYNYIDSNATALVEKEYLNFCIINQSKLILGLKKKLHEFLTILLDEVVNSHINMNKSICVQFDEISALAKKVPKNATELINQGTYMLHAKTVLVEDIKIRTNRQLEILSNLFQITTLSNEHIELNAVAINWLEKIDPIFEKYVTDQETYKGDMEEKLLSRINSLNSEVKEMMPYLDLLDCMDDINNTLEYLESLRKLALNLKRFDSLVKSINEEETTFKFPLTTFPELDELKNDILSFYHLVHLVHRWRRSYCTWMDGPFEYVDHIKIEEDHDYFYNEFINLSKLFKIKIKQQMAEGVGKRYDGLVDDPDIKNLPSPLKLCAQALGEIQKFKPNLQICHIMCNPALVQRHWDEMSIIAGIELTPDAGTSLRKIINHNLWNNIHQYKIISVAATNEMNLITTLNKMKTELANVSFKRSLYKDTRIYILSEIDEVQSILNEQILKTIEMKSSAFVKPFKDQICDWYETINRIYDTTNEWQKVQRQWLHLLPIFTTQYIADQIPEERAMFNKVNYICNSFMNMLENDPNVIKIAEEKDVFESLQTSSILLEKINEGVNSYLERIRLNFPRLFFVSNEEMYKILSETTNPHNIQHYIRKLFGGIHRLVFKNQNNITAMKSIEGETVKFLDCINCQDAKGSVEKWLLQVEHEMLKAVKSKTKLSYHDYPNQTRSEWILRWEGMIVLAVSQVFWSRGIHDALRTHNQMFLVSYYEQLSKQHVDTIALIRRTGLTNLQSITVKALIVIDVHAKDVTLELIGNNITEATDFHWLAQLRYYWEEEKVRVKIINAAVNYAYEYLGNSDRLVITPLTDRCYRTLISAYFLHLNGAPEGPAGTGKTETVKDLAKALAVQFVLFNCSDRLDYKAMGKFFKGLASCGAWVCFDELNRIDVEVLSVIAQQILCIVRAVRQNAETLVFEGTSLKLNPACYVCITMNPGYAGRSELPDNLKVLFRSVAMMVPDFAMIGEISLFSFGFTDARNLSLKIVSTYRLCSEQLSSQNHYDYGMRAVKTVLSAAGNLIRDFPLENESILILRSITDVNLPKFLSFDVPIFEAITSDLFPGIVLPKPNHKNLIAACDETCKRNNLQAVDCFLLKIIQTYEIMKVRHGFMLVGDSFSGKSMTLKILAESLTLMAEKGQPDGCDCTYKVLNPKAVTMAQLYGAFDPISYEWTDGIVATIFREFATDDTPVKKWIVFDGPVDAAWIENMNTVLDDNKKLCLTSGEVITMSSVMSVIFEVFDLTQASPATVSRCGMIFMESASFGFQPIYKSWMNTLNPILLDECDELIKALCEWVFNPLVLFVRKSCKQLIKAGNINLVVSTLNLVKMLMDDAVEEDEDPKNFCTWLIVSFVIALVWGVGGILDFDSRKKFDDFIKVYFRGEMGFPEGIDKLDLSLPVEGFIVDHYYMYKGKGCWKYWPDHVKNVTVIEQNNLLQTLVPTIDTEIYMYFMRLHLKYRKPILLVGPTGSGKTFYMQNFLMNKIDTEKNTYALINLTSTSSCNQTQELLLSKLIKKRNNFGPLKGKVAVLFVDDMNMPSNEVYGTHPAIELLRLLLERKYCYDLKTNEQLYINNTLFFGAISYVYGSRQSICPRILRHYNIYSINQFSQESKTKIFSTLLQISWRKNGFGQDVQPYIVNIVAATLEIYSKCFDCLRPVPNKSHYIFNVRDICKVIHGCSLLRKESAESKKTLVRIWIHEILRVFYDRLIDETDRDFFFMFLRTVTNDFMKETLEAACEQYVNESGEITKESLQKMMFGSYVDIESLKGEIKYEEISSKDCLFNLASSVLAEYNLLQKVKVNIVLFDYAIEHLSKICRLLHIPGGNALLIGVAGSGRQSLTRLAGIILGQNVFQPKTTNSYNLNYWHNDVKLVLREAGALNKDTVFLIVENQIKHEEFIQNIDSLLNSGEVPNLYEIDETQEIVEIVRLAAQGGNRNYDITSLQVMAYFVGCCKSKLHIVLGLSPVGNSLRERLRLYPSLVNCCTINWFDSWPNDALEVVANHYLANVIFPDLVKSSIVSAFKQFHDEAQAVSNTYYSKYRRKIHVTPVSYINLITTFTNLTNQKQQELLSAKLKYTNCLDKLNQAAETIVIMHRDLNDLKPQLIKMAAKSSQMMEEIEFESEIADKAAAQVKEDQKIANLQAAAAEELKKDCEADLAVALPILEDAVAALNTLKPSDITIVKSMKNPPATVKLVMAAVCVMRSVPPDKIPDPNNPGKKIFDYWGPSKRVLGDMSFLDQLKNFDKDNIPETTMAKIRKDYIANKDFKPQTIAKASTAAEGLCKWIIAMDMYDAVAKVVAPKKAKLSAAENEFAETMAILEEKKALAVRLEAKVANLNKALVEANIKKKELEDEVQLCTVKLLRAEKLIGGLSGEKFRWTVAAENFQLLLDNLAGDVLVSCGIITYLSPYILPVRIETISKWRNLVIQLDIPHSDVFFLKDVLGIDSKILDWCKAGLPLDNFSIENAIIQYNSNRWSIFIDPLEHASKWIKNMESINDLQILKFTDNNYLKCIVTCLEIGKPALIENILEDVDITLDSIQLKNAYTLEGKDYIVINDNVIEYHPHFRLYMITRLKNPNYLPEVFNKFTVINFTLIKEGLEEQLLDVLVAKERPDIQEKRINIMLTNAENKTALKQVEDYVLKTLHESKNDIIEDESMIDVLNSSKKLTKDVIKKQETNSETEIYIEKVILRYRPFASYSAVLYYCVTELPNVDPMYQYSLTWFTNLLKLAIKSAKKSKYFEKRLEYLQESFTYLLYCHVCRSLYDKDKLMFSFIMCTKTMLAKNLIRHEEYKFFITGGVSTVENTEKNPAEWLSDKSWNQICCLDDLPTFKGFQTRFVSSIEKWKTINECLDPENINLPGDWDSILSRFQKLLIIKIIRPDKLSIAILKFIEIEMGQKYITPPSFDINKSFGESTCLTPLVFILSPGSDPIGALLKYCDRMRYSNKFYLISMGQKQGHITSSMIKQAQTEGGWICLQNCHLADSWLPDLENIVASFSIANMDHGFRLWITTHSTDRFPQSVLQMAIKMTYEPPTGLKHKLNRSYNSELLNEIEFYNSCPDKEKAFRKLIYGVCFFHAVVQERKKFGPLGWNVQYGFNDSDFQITVMQLQIILNWNDKIQFYAIKYLTGECNYGGRVTDEWDRRLIVTLLDNFVNERVVNDNQYSFCYNSHQYGLPRRCNHKDYLKHIESIPDNPQPEIYGLHMNAGIIRDHKISTALMESLRLVEECGSEDNYCKYETILTTMASEILLKLPVLFDIEEAKRVYPIHYDEPMNTVLVQEMERFNKLLAEITTSVQDLQNTFTGFMIMTPALESQANDMVLGRIPDNWRILSYPSLKPMPSYIADLVERLSMFQSWFQKKMPPTFWLSGFYFTQGFLTGVIQNYARQNNVSFDLLLFDFIILSKSDFENSSPESGVYIYGLFMEGARWDREKHVIEEQHPKIFHYKMPVIWLCPKLKSQFVIGNRYHCPLFRTLERKGVVTTTGRSSNFVISFYLPSSMPSSHWILRSVALVLQLHN